MTVLADCRIAFAALIDAATTVTVSAYPMGENEPLDVIFLESSTSRFEWRSLGNAAKNRTEDISLEIVVRAYREAPSHGTAAAAAIARVEELLEVIETAVVTDAAGAFTISNTVRAGARIGEWTVRPYPREKGWAAEGRAFLVGTNIPA